MADSAIDDAQAGLKALINAMNGAGVAMGTGVFQVDGRDECHHRGMASGTAAGPQVFSFSVVRGPEAPEMTPRQRSFYAKHFRPRLFAGDPINVEGQNGYLHVLLHELLAQSADDLPVAATGMQLLRSSYRSFHEASPCLADMHFLLGDWAAGIDEAELHLSGRAYLGMAEALGHPRLKALDVFLWGQRSITKSGLRLLDKLIEELQDTLDRFHDEHGLSIVEDFWSRLTADKAIEEIVTAVRDDLSSDLDDADIAWFVDGGRKDRNRVYQVPVAFESYPQHARPIPVPNPWPNPLFYGRVWKDFLWTLIRDAEDKARVSAGLPRVGEGLVSEIRLLGELREAFPGERVNHQVRPLWLRPQSLDVVFAGRNVAVEYQGAQHSRPVKFFGGKTTFAVQQERDLRKRLTCKANGMHLIEVHPDYVLDDVIAEITLALSAPAAPQPSSTAD